MNCKNSETELIAFLSGDLDKNQSDELTHHVESCPECRVKLDSLSGLMCDIRSLRIEEMPMKAEELVLSSIKPYRTKKIGIAWFRVAKLRTLAASLLLVLLVLVLFLTRQQLTAAQLISNARQTAEKITSWHIRTKITFFEDEKKFREDSLEQWWKAPGSLKTINIIGVGNKQVKMINVITGKRHTIFSNQSEVAIIGPSTETDKSSILNRYELMTIKMPDDMSKGYLGSHARIVGTEKINDWMCDLIESDMPDGEKMMLAIDQVSGLPIRWDNYRKGQLFIRSEIVYMDVKSTVSSAIFNVTIPHKKLLVKGPVEPYTSEIRNLDVFSNPARTNERVRNALAFATDLQRHKPPLTLPFSEGYAPAYVPSGYKLAAVTVRGSRIEPVELHTNFIEPATGNSIVIFQGTQKPGFTGEQISRTGFDGMLSHFSELYPYAVLTWQKGDSWFTLYAGGLNDKEVIKIASSMKAIK